MKLNEFKKGIAWAAEMIECTCLHKLVEGEAIKRRLTFLAAFQEYCIAENIYQGL